MLLVSMLVSPTLALAEEELQPYFLVGKQAGTMEEVSAMVKDALTAGGFSVLGEYSPAGHADLHVIAYTREDLQQTTLRVEEQGALASVLKIGMKNENGTIAVSMLNPMYLFYAYLRDETQKHLAPLQKVTDDAKEAMKAVGTDFSGFGGSEEIDDLKKYHYMAFMPYFDDPVELNSFSSFQEGLNVLRKNLQSGKGNTLKVYELVFENEQVAVIGVGLLDEEEGEARFLPIIGDENIAAMPYEIILSGTEASMLHGKFRFALHWPELSMSQFMKISSTPGDVEDFLRALTE
jgi:hypothetical protein